ncbi:MAG: HTH-type transcriptional activator Btr [Lentisphaerae bacterium ADurb.Bin242]|nr:MAG: HTH-type transcriptional activator Btr [Lentisphaerae bacterium ADurb.Bin242]
MEQSRFTFVNVFHESVEFDRNYTLPFNMLDACIRSDGENASIATDLRTGEKLVSRRGTLTFIPCHFQGRYQHTLANERVNIHFKLEIYPGIDVFDGIKRRIVEYSPEECEELKAIFQVQDRIFMLSRCQEFALRFCHRHWPDHYEFNLEKTRRFDPVIHYILEKGNAKTEVPELAGLMRRSVGNFSREFSAAFHVSAKSYLQRELFKKASILLTAPESSVKLVAAQLNFSSEFYFSKFFKRLSGLSPAEYRKGAYVMK